MPSLYGLREVPIWREWSAPALVDVHLYLVDLDRVSERQAIGRLAAEEQARSKKLRDPVVRRRFVSRRSLLRHLISAELGVSANAVTYSRGRHGKPEVANLIDGQAFHFNTSTSDRWHAIATSRTGPVGIDIEAIGRPINYVQVLRAAASPEELRWHAAAESEAANLLAMRIWVAKEAILKATGRGLQINPRMISLPRDFVVPESSRAWASLTLDGFNQPFFVQTIADEHAVLALAKA